MSESRNAYILTTNVLSTRCIFSKKLLEEIGFKVVVFLAIPNADKVLSHKISMQHIYDIICADTGSEWSYVFEDDINILENISLSEIIEYEAISKKIIYLGMCSNHPSDMLTQTQYIIGGHPVYTKSGNIRGLHAIGMSRLGCRELLELSRIEGERHTDCILERYIKNSPATIIRYDLESYIRGHRGIFFQDRRKYPSELINHY